MGVREHLDLHVPGVGDVPLQEHRAVAERGGRLAAGGRHRLGQLAGLRDDPHPLAAAAHRGLDDQRQRYAAQVGQVVPGHLPGLARTGTPTSAISRLAASLSPITSMTSAGGPTQVSPAAVTAAGEAGPLGQEAVAGVDGVGSGGGGRRQQRIDVQVGLRGGAPRQGHRPVRLGDERRAGVTLGVHGDRADPHRGGGPDDAAGDLAPVRDEQRGDHSRNTPYPRAPCTGPLWQADSAMASTVLVSLGSMMPSSATRPVAYRASDPASA